MKRLLLFMILAAAVFVSCNKIETDPDTGTNDSIPKTLTVYLLNDTGLGTLRDAVSKANDGDTIAFYFSLSGQIPLSSPIEINKKVTILGSNNKITLSGQSKTAIFDISADCEVNNLGFTLGKGTTGGAVKTSAVVNFKNCDFDNNTASAKGGAIYINTSSSIPFNLTNCTFTNNKTIDGDVVASLGGAICAEDASGSASQLILNNCTISNNSSETGGAIYSTYSKLKIVDSKLDSNSSTIKGGAIYTSDAEMTRCEFSKNSSPYGGAVYSDPTNLSSFSHCSFSKNTSSNKGGAITSLEGLNIDNSTFDSNSTANGGGAIYHVIHDVNPMVLNSTFSNNSTDAKGGAIYIDNPYSGNQVFYLVRCTLSGEQDKGNSCSVYSESTSVTLIANLFYENIDELNSGMGSSRGGNIYTRVSSAFLNSTDYKYTGSQILLNPLNNYGGLTKTMPINTSIPNWATIARRMPQSVVTQYNITTDQRDLPLPNSVSACSGSVEVQPNESFPL